LNEKVSEEVNTKTFLLKLESEVKHNPRQAKKLTKLMSTTATMLTATLFTTLAPTAKSGLEIDPELKQMFMWAMVIIVLLGIVAAVIGGMLASIWKMFPFFGGKQAESWTLEIYKGFGQLLATPIIIGGIVILFYILFSKLPFFNPVKEAVNIFLS
jgi:hypothetical protein